MLNLPFAILRPVHQPARLDQITHLGCVTELHILDEIWRGFSFGNDVMALDFETRGDVDLPDSRVVTVALSDRRGTVTVDFRHEGGAESYRYIMANLYHKKIPIVAHNAYFDAAWPIRDLVVTENGDVLFSEIAQTIYLGGPGGGRIPDKTAPLDLSMFCSYATYRHLANEGWDGQRYGLDHAQLDLLGWEETNKDDVALWLTANGCVKKDVKKKLLGRDPKTFSDEELKEFLSCADKGQLWKVPGEVLLPYNALDADSTWLLWTYVLAPRLDDFKELRSWMWETYPAYTRILIDQKLRGIALDMKYLVSYREALEKKAHNLTREFRNHPDLHDAIALFEEAEVCEQELKEPPYYAKSTELPPEPPKLTKKGEVTTRWLKWDEKRRVQEREGRPVSGNWRDWRAKLERVKEEEAFSMTSPVAMGWLAYEWLGLEVRSRTDSGEPGTSVDALSHMPGADILAHWSTINKELTSVESLLGIQIDGIYHPKVKMPGTYTGRLSGAGGYNPQNVSKSPVLKAFAARPGHKLFIADITALENMVVTELSGDPHLMRLYGPDANPLVDPHLTNGADWPVMGPMIRSTGFDPDNPTAETVARAKKEAKAGRDMAKTTAYALIYGAGPGRLSGAFAEAGHDVSLEDCAAIREAYWTTHAGVQAWYRELTLQWRRNRGWFLNAFGRPMCVDKKYLKDVGSRAVQGAGHDAFTLLLLTAARVFTSGGVVWFPWNADVHDALMFEIAEHSVEDALRLWPIVLEDWNNQLGGVIKLKAEPAIVDNWMVDKYGSESEQENLFKKYGLL